jgi:AraC-like DNA-binding protein
MVYVEPALIFEAVRVLCGHACSLPFVRAPVVVSPTLSTAITSAFQSTREPLAIDGLIVQLAAGLIDADPTCRRIRRPRHLDVAAVERARQFLDTEKTRVVRSAELEAVTGLSRYDLARQFRLVCGTSPYRYLLMRRLDLARDQIARRRPLVEVALDAGFADQAHFTRAFKATYGLTPAHYGALIASTVPMGSGAREAGAPPTSPAPPLRPRSPNRPGLRSDRGSGDIPERESGAGERSRSREAFYP